MANPGQSERERDVCVYVIVAKYGVIGYIPVSGVVYIAVVVRQCGFLDC